MRELGVSEKFASGVATNEVYVDFIEQGGISQWSNNVRLGRSYPHNSYRENIPVTHLGGTQFLIAGIQQTFTWATTKQFISFIDGGYSSSLGTTITNMPARFKWYGDTVSFYYVVDIGRTSTVYRLSCDSGGTAWGGTQVIGVFGQSNIVRGVAPVSDDQVFVQHNFGTSDYRNYVNRYDLSAGTWSLGLTYPFAFQTDPALKTSAFNYDDNAFEAVKVGQSKFAVYHTVSSPYGFTTAVHYHDKYPRNNVVVTTFGTNSVYGSRIISSGDASYPTYVGHNRIEIVGTTPFYTAKLYFNTYYKTADFNITGGRKDNTIIVSEDGKNWSAPITVGSNVIVQSNDGTGFFLLPITGIDARGRTFVKTTQKDIATERAYTYSNNSNEDITLELPKNGVL